MIQIAGLTTLVTHAKHMVLGRQRPPASSLAFRKNMDHVGREIRDTPSGRQRRERVLTPQQFTVTRREHRPDFFIQSLRGIVGAIGGDLREGALDLLAAFSEARVGIVSKEVDFLLDGLQTLGLGVSGHGLVAQECAGS